MKLGLGTVQFGMNYGISNKAGQPQLNEVREILALASAKKVRCLDTAALYGNSEEVLGETLPPTHSFEIVTKTGKDVTRLEEVFQKSLKNLKQKNVYGLLVHNADDLIAPGGELLYKKMQELKKYGLVKKIGVSVYNNAQIDKILSRGDIDIIQLPINLLDQRLIESGHLKKLKKAGVEIHARSVFLQGLLLMLPERLPKDFDSVRKHLIDFRASVEKIGLSVLQAALGFVLNLEEVDRVLVGVNTKREFEEILLAASKAQESLSGLKLIAPHAAWNDEKILNPALWRQA
jgi:aryl-alcohol dehydrogenase-like predicted oxidoreductase